MADFITEWAKLAWSWHAQSLRRDSKENKNFVFDAAVAEKLLLFDAHEGVASENQSIESLWSLLLS